MFYLTLVLGVRTNEISTGQWEDQTQSDEHTDIRHLHHRLETHLVGEVVIVSVLISNERATCGLILSKENVFVPSGRW